MAEQVNIRETPYKGLVPYSEEDAAFFFGRERERDNIISRLLASRLTLLYGPSGVGKSSVLRAGVAHHLRELSQGSLDEDITPEFVVIVFSIWRDDPLVGLSKHIRDTMKRVERDGAMKAEASPSFALALKGWTDRVGCDLLIILDQFEEYFLYHGQESGKGTFVEEFPRVVNRSDLRVNFLVSIREDALAKLDRFKGRIPNLFDNYLRIKHLGKDAAYDAIKKPIEKYNALRGDDPPFSIEDELVEEVCEEIKTGEVVLGRTGPAPLLSSDAMASGEAEIEAPYLQLVMSRIWDEETRKNNSRILRRETLNELGGAKHIVKTHLDEVMRDLTYDEQHIASRIFHYLVTPSGTKIAYTAHDLSINTHLPIDELTKVLQHLSSSDLRILRTVPSILDQPADPRYEIFHDVLGPAILDWTTRYTQSHEKARLAEETERNLERERRRTKRLTLYLIFVILFSALVIIAIHLFNRQRDAVRQARSEAMAQKTEVDKQRAEAQSRLDTIVSIDSSAAYFKASMRGHDDAVNSAVFSPDGKVVATVGAGKDNTVRLWEAETGHSLAVLRGHTDAINSIAFNSDGRRLVTASKDKTARLWEMGKGENGAVWQMVRELTDHTETVNKASFSPDDKLVVTASADTTARIWDIENGKSTKLEAHKGEVNNAVFSPHGNLVVTASADGTAVIWSAPSWQNIFPIKAYQGVVEPKGEKSGAHKKEVLAPKGEKSWPQADQIVKINNAVFSRDGNLVVTAETYGAQVWDIQAKRRIALFTEHTGAVNDASFSPDGKLVVTADSDHSARIWDVKSQRMKLELKGHTDVVLSATFSPNGKRVITTSPDRTARVWDVATGVALFELRGHTDRVNSAAFRSPDGDLAVTASDDKTARVWNLTGEGGLRVSEVSLQSNPENYVGPCPATISLSGKIVVSGGSGPVTYRFIRSNGYPSSTKTLIFDSPGTKEVTSVWRFGGIINHNPSGTFNLQILSPQEKTSNEVKFNIRCDLQNEEKETPPGSGILQISPANGHIFEKPPAEISFQWSPAQNEVPGIKYRVKVELYGPNNRELTQYTSEHMITLPMGQNWTSGKWMVTAESATGTLASSGWYEFSIQK